MAIANGLALPNPLSNGTVNDAIPVMADFNYLLAALNRALIDSGGGAGVNAQAVQIHNLANGTSPNDAVNLSQLGGFAALAGAAFTGATSFAAATTVAALTASGLITGNAGFSGTTLGLSGNATIGGGETVAGVASAVGVQVRYNAGISKGIVQFTTADGSTQLGSLETTSGSVFTLNCVSLAVAGACSVSGSFSVAGALSLTGMLTTGVAANSVGYLGVPSSTKTVNYTLGVADVGTAVNMNGTSLACTIPANASVAIPVDSVILVTNLNASPLSIPITTDTLIWSGTTSTGTRTLAQNGEARLRKIAATTWLIAGTGLS